MSISLFDSEVFSPAWKHNAVADVFDESKKMEDWLYILQCLAECQSDLGLIPKESYLDIKQAAVLKNINFVEWKKNYISSGHSMLGLIQQINSLLPKRSQGYFYYGATVQDITDTWTSRALQKVHSIVLSQALQAESLLIEISKKYKATVMAGRTHGQIGSPITFGYKAAVWLAELRRHRSRLMDCEKRMGYAQLSGSVGSMGAYPEQGPELLERFAKKLNLKIPYISWTSSRDTLVEFFQVLVLISSLCEKIGTEIYNLQRQEIGELKEGSTNDQVGSITMPHKTNPEISEHLGTLALLIRKNVNSLADSLAHQHERDGKAWKLEWMVIPDTCNLFCACFEKTIKLLAELKVDEVQMAQNLSDTDGFYASEKLMWELSKKFDLVAAREQVRTLCKKAFDEKRNLKEVVLESKILSSKEVEDIFSMSANIKNCQIMVDQVLAWVKTNA